MLNSKSLRSFCVALVLVGLATTPASGVPGSVLNPPKILSFVEAEYDYMGLDAPRSPAVSPDNKHIYVAGRAVDAVAVFSRDTSSGALTFVQELKNYSNNVIGLGGPYSIAVSPDGFHVYVAAIDSNAVVVFDRDDTTGMLTFVEMQQDGVGGVNGLDGAHSITVSPGGAHVYVASVLDNAVAVFGRDGSTGALTYAGMVQNDGSVNGLDGARSVTVSPDGLNVYVAGSSDDAVAVFSRDGSTGALTYVEMQQDDVAGVNGLDGARSVTVSPDGFHVYATGAEDDAVAVFSRDESTGRLTYVEMQQDGASGVDGLDFVQSVTVSPDGDHVYAASGDDDAVAVFGRNDSTGELTFVEMQQDGVGGVDGLNSAASVTVSPDGFHVYATGYLDDAIVAFSRNGTTGALTFADLKMHTSPYTTENELDGARSVAVSPDGNHVYAAAREDDALAVFDRDGTSGELTSVQMLDEGTSPIDGLSGANSVAISPDGKHVYVASGDDDAVAVFSRTVPAGTLEFTQVVTDGAFMVDSLNFATSVAVSPDGKHVYVTAAQDNAVTAFRRYTTTGQLQVIEDYIDGDMSGFVDGLAGAYSVIVSPDGYHVYVAGGQDDEVAGFVRNANSGELFFFQVISDTGSVVNGLDRPRSLAISPDGEHVYVASMNADTLTVYDRNPNTGNLSFVEIHQDGSGVFGLEGAHAVAVSPNGKHVYAAGSADDAVVVFSRDPISGRLTFEEEIYDNTYGFHGLEYPASIALSPGGSHVYVAGFHDDSVAVFERHLFVYLPLVVRDY